MCCRKWRGGLRHCQLSSLISYLIISMIWGEDRFDNSLQCGAFRDSSRDSRFDRACMHGVSMISQSRPSKLANEIKEFLLGSCAAFFPTIYNSCNARIFSLYDFHTILNAKDYGVRGLWLHNLKIPDLPPDQGPVSTRDTVTWIG